MLVLSKREVSLRDTHDMTRDELETERSNAKESFDQALMVKIETDRIYVDAANRLNALDRLVKKVEQRTAAARRDAIRYLYRTT